MTIPFPSAEASVRSVVETLTSHVLIRLVTEIDDNGAIPLQRLNATLPDLSPHQLRHAVATACTRRLVRDAGTGLDLTAVGSELADLYDAAARWSRSHDCPAPVCEFSARVRHVLGLLAASPADGQGGSLPCTAAGPSPCGTDDGLAGLRVLLIRWLAGASQGTRAAESRTAA